MDVIHFSKMNGAGNDFVVLDKAETDGILPAETVRRFCDRKRGVGADGLIMLAKTETPNQVVMDFFNCDGSRADMCGNGLRCAALYAVRHGLANANEITFATGSGELHTEIQGEELVQIELLLNQEFKAYEKLIPGENVYHGIVGVPHAVVRMDGLHNADIVPQGRMLRNHKAFAPAGTNVDFLEFEPTFKRAVLIRTFERGVEDETLACGTGVGSSAVVLNSFYHAPEELMFQTKSGDILRTKVIKKDGKIQKVLLAGPAIEVFRGTIISKSIF